MMRLGNSAPLAGISADPAVIAPMNPRRVTCFIEAYSLLKGLRERLQKVCEKVGSGVCPAPTRSPAKIPGSKLDKARELGVEIIDEKKLIELLGGRES